MVTNNGQILTNGAMSVGIMAQSVGGGGGNGGFAVAGTFATGSIDNSAGMATAAMAAAMAAASAARAPTATPSR